MSRRVYFSSSSKVWDDISWIFGIEEAGFDGWEIVADGSYRLDVPSNVRRIDEAISSTHLGVTVHAPYADLNLATLNHPIWRESIRQVTCCIAQAAEWTDRVTVHPGYVSPVGKIMPDRVWAQQKEALREIGQVARDHGVVACLENMIGAREFLCRDPGELLGMVDGIEGAGITIDIGHAHTVGLVREFLPLVPRASHMHVHDNSGQSDEHLPVGEGTVDWELVGKTVAREYSGIVVVEGRGVAEGKRSLSAVREWRG
ncbi:MAG: sugar phosphate isomerase/epimerase family protein [Methanolinea sp.]|nr:sugar phosphate isomerase/epimerase family protein [Methanolinea sp.]